MNYSINDNAKKNLDKFYEILKLKNALKVLDMRAASDKISYLRMIISVALLERLKGNY